MSTFRILNGMFLMAASNIVAWHMVFKTSKSSISKLRSSVWKIALFYTLWALYNKYLGGRPQELGHLSFGSLVLACLGTARFCKEDTKPIWTRLPLLLSCGIVVLNFSIVLPMIAKNGPFGMAKLVWEDAGGTFLGKLWGLVFSAYIFANVALWSYCEYKFVKLPLTDRKDDGYTTPTIDEVDYTPVQTEDV